MSWIWPLSATLNWTFTESQWLHRESLSKRQTDIIVWQLIFQQGIKKIGSVPAVGQKTMKYAEDKERNSWQIITPPKENDFLLDRYKNSYISPCTLQSLALRKYRVLGPLNWFLINVICAALHPNYYHNEPYWTENLKNCTFLHTEYLLLIILKICCTYDFHCFLYKHFWKSSRYIWIVSN